MMYIGNEPEPLNDPEYDEKNIVTEKDIILTGIAFVILMIICTIGTILNYCS